MHDAASDLIRFELYSHSSSDFFSAFKYRLSNQHVDALHCLSGLVNTVSWKFVTILHNCYLICIFLYNLLSPQQWLCLWVDHHAYFLVIIRDVMVHKHMVLMSRFGLVCFSTAGGKTKQNCFFFI